MCIFIIQLDLKQDGYLLAILISNILFLAIATYLILPEITFQVDLKYFKEVFSYSLPIIPFEVIGITCRMVDRYYILIFIGLSGTGIYFVGVQISNIINLIILAINSAYTPILFKKYENLKNEDFSDIYRLADFIIFIVLSVTVAIILIYPFFIKLFSPEYKEIEDFIIYLVFSSALSAIYVMNVNILSLKREWIKFQTISVSIGTLINIIIGYFLIKNYGLTGAAISTLVSFSISTLVIVFIVNIKTDFNGFSSLKYFLLFLIMFILVNISIKIEYVYILVILGSYLLFLFYILIVRKELKNVNCKKRI
jgi:O-antigen/teichoic acid export membrane protein